MFLGNDGQDACLTAPSGSADAFAVGAIDATDAITSYSNYGPCVKIFAPGDNIPSDFIGSFSATDTFGPWQYMSGTSMSSPHVAGITALYLSMYDFTSVDDIYRVLTQGGNANQITNVNTGTVNLLAYNYEDPSQTPPQSSTTSPSQNSTSSSSSSAALPVPPAPAPNTAESISPQSPGSIVQPASTTSAPVSAQPNVVFPSPPPPSAAPIMPSALPPPPPPSASPPSGPTAKIA